MAKVFLIDASNLIHRSFYAMGDMASSSGFPTGAIYGFLSMLMNLVQYHKMEHVIICFDVAGASTYRRELYPLYKANRVKEGVDLIGPQIKIIASLMQDMGIMTAGIPGYEADDLIASFAYNVVDSSDTHEVIVVTSDKDLMMLVGDRVKILDTMKRKTFDARSVVDKWGVQPNQIADYLAIVGDPCDNIPGGKGLGPAAAKAMLNSFPNVQEILANINDPSLKKYAKKLQEHNDIILLSKELTSFRLDSGVFVDWNKTIPQPSFEGLRHARDVLLRLSFNPQTVQQLLRWVSIS